MTIHPDIEALLARGLPARPEDAPWLAASWLEKITVEPAPGVCRIYGRVLLGPCWLWQGATNGKGHARVRIDGVLQYLHRHSLASFLGVDIASLDNVDHLCRNRNCCQPLHLESVTAAENYDRGDGHLTQIQFQPKQHELSDDDVRGLLEGF